jgi:hypothetical protein
METRALQHGNDAVKLAAMVKRELHMQNVIANLANQVNQVTVAAQQTQNAAGNAQAVATVASNADRFRPAARLPSTRMRR